MVTIKEIADLAGVSTTTVSNVIHGKTRKVSRQNIDKIQQILKEKKYVTPMGRSLLTNGRSQIIGVVLFETKHYGESLIGDPFYSKLIGVIGKYLQDAGYYMMLYSSDDLDAIFHMAIAWNVDGLICLSFTNNDYNKICSLTEKPAVTIDLYNDMGSDYMNVGLQDEEGGYQMTRYLIQSGFSRILILALRDWGVDHDRFMGYRRALKEYGIPYKKEYFVSLHDEADKRQDNYQRLCRFLKKDYAMFFLSDWYAIEAMAYFQKAGYRIPDDVSVAGFDDSYFCTMCVPALTTVHQEVAEKGRRAVEMLLHVLNGEQVGQKRVLLPVSLVIRDSVKRKENLNSVARP